MDRIVGANTIDLGGGKRGFRGKDTVAGIAGTELAATWHNQIQEEQMTLIEGSGQVPADGDLQQLAKAYQTGRFSFGGNAGGTANALAITLSPQPNSWDALIGAQINLIVTTNNTAAATLAIAGLPGTKPITRPGGAALSKGDLVAGMVLRGAYDGTSVQMAGITQSVPGAVQVYATPGTTNWTVPTGVFKIRARVWGAAAAAGRSSRPGALAPAAMAAAMPKASMTSRPARLFRSSSARAGSRERRPARAPTLSMAARPRSVPCSQGRAAAVVALATPGSQRSPEPIPVSASVARSTFADRRRRTAMSLLALTSRVPVPALTTRRAQPSLPAIPSMGSSRPAGRAAWPVSSRTAKTAPMAWSSSSTEEDRFAELRARCRRPCRRGFHPAQRY